ncbi:P-loop containing nucleoside triphosphate hydrolase protein [Gloeophyllum trabeum ATCC 11539]|uniref:p-loop containing nucleoside triphosphate hydrolase protein n=1 Tax=Gloeophyllum trabeum (strain ATCC 11539 / FP-39264 / Madison 617) TaxID=670483 RepID=S7Q6P2_GLOTA|nr:P-loop containing nucleoside triphosphate hydrolase protein [Gloeophyllum trabeum ATCC 11539]EPQ55098.1 P-loop containing nucleoside triphosphate hydrolase protein [Gloeophyllum trabeum ATCC 11539]
MAQHVLAHLPPSPRSSPLLVGIQGPQGSGKTFLTSHLRSFLASPPYSLSVCVLSIDDLYLPHSGLKRVAAESSDNRLLQGRGLPGTHDVPLGSEVLAKLRAGEEVELPVFEKSLFDGEGDRLPRGQVVRPPLDVVLLEGWFVGFAPLTQGELERKWEEAPERIERGKGDALDLRAFVKREDVADVNERLRVYVGWWEMLDVFIQLSPRPARAVSPHSLIYKWRLEQEHNMKAKNGGKGMSDEAVKAFVDRYIPGYVFFQDGVTEGYLNPATGERVAPQWVGKGLRVLIGEERQVVGTEAF